MIEQLFYNYRKAQHRATEALNELHNYLHNELKDNIDDLACISFVIKCGEANQEKDKLKKVYYVQHKLQESKNSNLALINEWCGIPKYIFDKNMYKKETLNLTVKTEEEKVRRVKNEL